MRQEQASPTYAVTRCLNKLAAEHVDWLWPGRIPLGGLTLLVGDPGVGKSLLVADIAARVSAALPWPDDPAAEKWDAATAPALAPVEQRTDEDVRRRWPPIRGHMAEGILPSGVVLASPEDRGAGVLQARLKAAGADLEQITSLDGVTDRYDLSLPAELRHLATSEPLSGTGRRRWDFETGTAAGVAAPKGSQGAEPEPTPLVLPAHLGALEQAIRGHGHPRLVVLDPVNALLSAEARTCPDVLARLLGSLASMARRKEVAIVAVGHLVKAQSDRLLYRVRGSLAFVAAARAVLLVSGDPDQPGRCVLSAIKSVFGAPPAPLEFRIGEGGRLEWEVEAKAGEREADAGRGAGAEGANSQPGAARPSARRPWALRADLLDRKEKYSAIAEACDWLAAYLAAGPRPAGELLADARAAGINAGTLRRAKRLVGVRSWQAERTWMWGVESGELR